MLMATAFAAIIAVTVSGCAAAAPADENGGVTTSAATSEPTGTPQPIEQVVALDPGAPALVQSARDLVAATDGFASGDARTALQAAADRLDADIRVVQLSMAGGPAASQADPPVDEVLLAADTATLTTALGAVRDGVVATSWDVVNVGAADADQAVRDEVYLAVMAERAVPAADAATTARLVELIRLTRAAQDSQSAVLQERDRLAAEQAAAAESESSSGGGGGGEAPTEYRAIPFVPLPVPVCPPFIFDPEGHAIGGGCAGGM